MYAQCSQAMDGGGLIQFGVKDGITYIFTAIGAGHVAAIATPGASGNSVKAWLSVGVGADPASPTSGSYAVMALTADPAASSLELSVAGLGVGYCGVQLASDGSLIRATGSTDMGTSCNAVDNLCVAAATGAVATGCTEPYTYGLPAIGRKAVGGAAASLYPATPSLTFDGTASDPVHFGPATPTAGVAAL